VESELPGGLGGSGGTEEHVECEALLRLGINFGQGYLFGHPEPVDAYV
jgi:EAL domain-containing protein (putative c-di-GMP-specific phosphodiesterase class I)